MPGSFTGGTKYMFNNSKDAMVICKKIGYPDLFITITWNVNLSEIREFVLVKGLSTLDIPDIVYRVFKMKLDEMMTDFKKKDFFGKTTTGLCSVSNNIHYIHIDEIKFLQLISFFFSYIQECTQ